MTRFLLCFFIFAAMAEPLCAETSAKNACGVGANPPANASVQMDRDVAIFMVKHAQRACQLITDFAQANPTWLNRTFSLQLDRIIAKLREDVLAPIYATHPVLLGLDLTNEAAEPYEDRFKNGPKRSDFDMRLSEGRFGEASARYFGRVLGETTQLIEIAADPKPVATEAQGGLTVGAYRDLRQEIVFLKLPIFDRLRADLDKWAQEAEGRPLPREALDHFREVAPPAGSVQVSTAALDKIRKVVSEARAQRSDTDSVIGLMWTKHLAAKGPLDQGWTDTGPAIHAISWTKAQIPADIISDYEGIAIFFVADTRERFAGKLVDIEEGKLVIKDH